VVALPAGSSHRVSFSAPSSEEQNSAMLLVFMGGQFETDPKTGACFDLLIQLIKVSTRHHKLKRILNNMTYSRMFCIIWFVLCIFSQ
jgi:hypothetical protein